jgi:dihydroneopterin aldolase
MGKIILENIELYAYHGHMPEERKIGSKFLINVELDTAFEESCNSDDLSDTLDYTLIYNIIKEEMKIPSSLLEHVANRILTRLSEASPLVWAVKIRLAKLNPPFGDDVEAVAVELYKERDS